MDVEIPDWDSYSPTLSSFRMANRTSTAAMLVFPSASNFSRSLTFSRYDLMDYGDSLKEPMATHPYTLSNFYNSGPVNDNGEEINVYESICTWIKREIVPCFERDIKKILRVISEKSLNDLYQSQVPLETSTDKRPDVGIFIHYKGKLYPVLQIEVDSGGYQSTWIKLAQGVGDQLVWVRNCDNSVATCVGMYFPTFKRGNGVVKLQLEWCDDQLQFIVTKTWIPFEQLKEVLFSAVQVEIANIRSLPHMRSTHKVPLTTSFVHETFGNTACQMESGESIVVMNMPDRVVYKYPLEYRSQSRLNELWAKTMVTDCEFTRFLVPHGKLKRGYFEFKLLKPPIKVQLALAMLVKYVSGVVLALKEFHEFGMAHLDVRIENVCFDQDNNIVLVDLDRSQQVDNVVRSVTTKESLMYPVIRGWTYRNWDWRQLALMIVHILGPRSSNDYHTVEPNFSTPSLDHVFLKTLYNDGKPFSLQYYSQSTLSPFF